MRAVAWHTRGNRDRREADGARLAFPRGGEGAGRATRAGAVAHTPARRGPPDRPKPQPVSRARRARPASEAVQPVRVDLRVGSERIRVALRLQGHPLRWGAPRTP
jgi:hypothetical protein